MRLYIIVIGIMLGISTVNLAATSHLNRKKNSHHSSISATEKKTASHIVDINTASAKTLADIKGIGPKRAEAIINYRQQHGKFRSIDDLTNIKGIGPKLLQRIAPRLTVNK